MEGLEAGVLDAPEVELESPAVETETPSETPEPSEPSDTPDSDAGPYTTRFSREFRAAMKQIETQHPEWGKFAKQARDNHARLFALNQIEPKGIDGVRERYELLNSIALGEHKGPEALTAMQETLQGIEETDRLLAEGDPAAFDALGEDFNAGLAKLAPHYLDRIEKTDPQAYANAILPHLVKNLASSDLVKSYNDLVDVLNTQDDPRFDEKTKLKFAIQQIAKMGAWFQAQEKKVGEFKASPTPANGHAKPDEERTALETERQQFHWDSKIKPGLVQHENQTFESLFAPYQKRLRLDDKAKAALLSDFKAGLSKAGSGDKAYIAQMGIYRKQGTPDPSTVQNYVKNAITRHGKGVLEGIVTARYGRFLTAQQKTGPVTPQNGKKPLPPPEPQVEVKTVMPPRDQIDFQRTPIPWLARTNPGGPKYRLFNGKVIQVRLEK